MDGDPWGQLRFNPEGGDYEEWSKPVIPITNGYGYLDMAWDPQGNIWAGGGNGTCWSAPMAAKNGKKIPWEQPPEQFHSVCVPRGQ